MSDEETRNYPPVRREMEEAAVKMALEGRWQEAEQLNREILEREPENVEALNRLGKALLELRRYEESYAVYGRSLELDPYNRIARKNRERLTMLLTSTPAPTAVQKMEHEQILPDLFISESGKSAVVPLYAVSPPTVLQRLSRGEAVRLEAVGQMVLVKTEEGTPLGRLDPRIGRRLAEFIQMGNRYAAAIAEIDENNVKVFIRETYQHPQLVGKLSFPPLTAISMEMVRPYIRDLGLHLEEVLEQDLIEEEEEEGEEEEEIEEEEDLGLDEEELEITEEQLPEEAPEEDEPFEEDLEEEI